MKWIIIIVLVVIFIWVISSCNNCEKTELQNELGNLHQDANKSIMEFNSLDTSGLRVEKCNEFAEYIKNEVKDMAIRAGREKRNIEIYEHIHISVSKDATKLWYNSLKKSYERYEHNIASNNYNDIRLLLKQMQTKLVELGFKSVYFKCDYDSSSSNIETIVRELKKKEKLGVSILSVHIHGNISF